MVCTFSNVLVSRRPSGVNFAIPGSSFFLKTENCSALPSGDSFKSLTVEFDLIPVAATFKRDDGSIRNYQSLRFQPRRIVEAK